MRQMSLIPSCHLQTETDYVVDWEMCRHYSDARKFTMYHMTQLKHLVEPHERSVGSCGILNDGGMHYGIMHGDGIGVYCYASKPYERFF